MALWRNQFWNGAASTRNTETGVRTFYWVLCGACGGPTVPTSTLRRRYSEAKRCSVEEPEWHLRSRWTGRRMELWGECSACGCWSVMKTIKARGSAVAGRGRERCGGACLNGKHSCDCKCMGKCHGAGACRCGTEAA